MELIDIYKSIWISMFIKKKTKEKEEEEEHSSYTGRSVAWKQYTLPQDTAVLHFEA
jgi:hypothetical protein